MDYLTTMILSFRSSNNETINVDVRSNTSFIGSDLLKIAECAFERKPNFLSINGEEVQAHKTYEHPDKIMVHFPSGASLVQKIEDLTLKQRSMIERNASELQKIADLTLKQHSMQREIERNASELAKAKADLERYYPDTAVKFKEYRPRMEWR
jgi:hypothetical protein